MLTLGTYHGSPPKLQLHLALCSRWPREPGLHQSYATKQAPAAIPIAESDPSSSAQEHGACHRISAGSCLHIAGDLEFWLSICVSCDLSASCSFYARVEVYRFWCSEDGSSRMHDRFVDFVSSLGSRVSAASDVRQ